MIQVLIDYFDEEYANDVVRCFVKNVSDDEASAIDVHRKHTSASTKHWTTFWKRQAHIEREQTRDRLARAQYRKRGVKKSPKPSKLEDIRDWSLEEMLEHLLVCLSDASLSIVTEYGVVDTTQIIRCQCGVV